MRYKPSTSGQHHIFHAIELEDLEQVATILREDPEAVRARDEYQCTPLHRAASGPRLPLVELLLAHGANPNARANCRQTPLHHVTNEQVAAAMVKAGAIRTLKDDTGTLPLTWAIRDVNGDLARILCPDEIFFDPAYRKAFHWPKLSEDAYYPSTPAE